MSVLINFAMFPTDKGESASFYVAKILKMIDESGVVYKLDSKGTSIETDNLDQALDIINKSYKILEEDCKRVYSVITMDIRKGKNHRMTQKIKSIEDKIGQINH